MDFTLEHDAVVAGEDAQGEIVVRSPRARFALPGRIDITGRRRADRLPRAAACAAAVNTAERIVIPRAAAGSSTSAPQPPRERTRCNCSSASSGGRTFARSTSTP